MNTITKGYKFRIYPNNEQKKLIAKTIGCSRYVYNSALKSKREQYKEDKTNLKFKDLSKQLTALKQQEETIWLSEVPATCLIQSLRDLDTAFSRFFNGASKYPKFKKKTSAGSIRMQDVVYKDQILKLPKLGEVKVNWSQELPAAPKMAVVSRDSADRYFVSFQVETNIELLPITGNSIGIDVGIKEFCYFSTGESISNPRYLKNKQKSLRRSQRVLARRNKESKRRELQRLKVAKLHARVSDTRCDFQHQLSTRIVRENDIISVENLQITNLMKNHKLAGSIADAGWGEFIRQLEYKANWYGKTLIRVAPHYTSRDCSTCGTRYEKQMKLSIREWTCSCCGTTHDRDHNAAINILNRGLNELIPGGTGKLTDRDIISADSW